MEVTNEELKELFNQCRDGLLTPELKVRLGQMQKEELNSGDKNDVTLLHVACCNSNVEVVQELLKQKNINVTARDCHQRTLLHAAVLGKHFTEHPKYSKDNKNFMKEKDVYFKTTATDSNQQLEVISILFGHEEASSFVNNGLGSFHLFRLAVQAKVAPSILEYLVSEAKLNRDINDCNIALVNAIHGDQVALLAVMAKDPSFNLNYITPQKFSLLGLAIDKNKHQCLKFLLDHPSVDVSCMGKEELSPVEVNPLILSITGFIDTEEQKIMKKEQMEILMYNSRIDINVPPSVNVEWPIHRSALLSDPFFLNILLCHPQIDVNVKTRQELSAVKFAAMRQYEEHADLLLTHPKIEINNDRAIFDIVEFGSPSIVLKALAAGADPNANEWNEPSELHLNLYEYNLLLCGIAEDLNQAKERLQTGKVLLEAGCHPTVSKNVIDELKEVNSELTKKHRDIIENLKILPKTTVQSLASASRAALYKQARIVKGPFATCDLFESLISTENLPKDTNEFLTFNNAIKRKFVVR